MERETLVKWCAAMNDHDVKDCDRECLSRCNLWRIIRHVLYVSNEVGMDIDFVPFLKFVHEQRGVFYGTQNVADLPLMEDFLPEMSIHEDSAQMALLLLEQLPEQTRIPASLYQKCAEKLERMCMPDAPMVSDAIAPVPYFMEKLAPTGRFVLHEFFMAVWFQRARYNSSWIKFRHCGAWQTKYSDHNSYDEPEEIQLCCVMCGIVVDYWNCV